MSYYYLGRPRYRASKHRVLSLGDGGGTIDNGIVLNRVVSLPALDVFFLIQPLDIITSSQLLPGSSLHAHGKEG